MTWLLLPYIPSQHKGVKVKSKRTQPNWAQTLEIWPNLHQKRQTRPNPVDLQTKANFQRVLSPRFLTTMSVSNPFEFDLKVTEILRLIYTLTETKLFFFNKSFYFCSQY
jgi:hypothetical protein